MAYEKKTGFVDLKKLENDSELTMVSGGTAKKSKVSICTVHTHDYFCVDPKPVPQLPPQR